MPHILDLHQAILTGNKEGVIQLSKSGMDLGAPIRGTTALSLAVYHGKLDSLQILIQAGAPLDRRSKDHLERLETPLISAIRLGHWEIFEELVKNGANLDIRDFYNQTPLWFAVKEQRQTYVRTLLKCGAQINFTKATENPLNIAMQFLGYRGRREMALELVAAGLPLMCEDYNGHSPLYYTMKYADFEFFRLLVEAGAPLKKHYDWLGRTYLPQRWQENEGIMSWLIDEMKSPLPLKRQCRTVVRTHLRDVNKTDLRPLIQALNLPGLQFLPHLLLKYLLLEKSLLIAAQNAPG